MTKKESEKYTVKINSTIRKAIKKLDQGGIGFIACVDGREKVVGIVTDGDFRKAVLRGVDLNQKIDEIANRDFRFLESGYRDDEARWIFENTYSRRIPILKEGKLEDVLTEEQFFKGAKRSAVGKSHLDLPVVIMAGGAGRRLDPFTRILPKPLIPIGNKPIIEIIMDKFARYGMTTFHVSVHDKAKMVKAYFEEFEAGYSISFIDEDEPLGTIGAIRRLEGKIDSPFFVSNCDIIVDCDYSRLFESHKTNKYDLTLVTSMQHYTIPYGVCEIEEGGILKEMKEKPEYDFLVNTGLYLLNPGILSLIPPQKRCDITDLIKLLQAKGKRVGVYPVSEKSWKDFGEWEKYHKKVGDLDTT